MKRFLFFVLLLCSSAAFAQSAGPTNLTGSQCLSTNIFVSTPIVITVTGSWSGILQPQVLGQIGQNVTVTPIGITTPQPNIRANGIFTTTISGPNAFQVCAQSISGTATVTFAPPAQTSTAGNLTGSQCLALDVYIPGLASVVVTGNWSGQLQPQVYVAPPLNGTVNLIGVTTPQSTILNNGTYTTYVTVPNVWQLCAEGITGTASLTMTSAVTASVSSGSVTSVSSGIGLTATPNPLTNTGTIALNPALPNGETATTQTTGDDSTKVATDAFVQANGGGGGGTVTHTAGALTAGQIAIGNGGADLTVDPDASTNGAGAMTAVSYGTSGSNGGVTFTEGSGAGLTPATGADLLFGSSSTHRLMQNPNDIGNLMIPGVGSVATPAHVAVFATNGIDLVDGGAPCTTTCVTSVTGLTSTDIMTGAGSQASQTPSSAATLNSSGQMAAAQLLVTGILDGAAPITITTGATANLGSTYKSGYTFNQEATAGTGVTYTLPPTATGLQYCVQNSGTTSVVNTGVLTVYPLASSFVILNGVVNTVGGGGTHGVASGGAAGDGACFVAIDSTHWEVFPTQGTWTEN